MAGARGANTRTRAKGRDGAMAGVRVNGVLQQYYGSISSRPNNARHGRGKQRLFGEGQALRGDGRKGGTGA